MDRIFKSELNPPICSKKIRLWAVSLRQHHTVYLRGGAIYIQLMVYAAVSGISLIRRWWEHCIVDGTRLEPGCCQSFTLTAVGEASMRQYSDPRLHMYVYTIAL